MIRPPHNPPPRGPGRDRGFVLINALVLVAALAALATWLLSRAETGRLRAQVGLEAAQLTLALEALEALAQTRLLQDATPVDHPGEAWATALPPLALAEGEVAGQLLDLQGRFNVNWLADPDNLAAQTAFDRLLTQLALPGTTGDLLRRFLQPGGQMSAADRAAWRRLDPPQDPVGGPVLSADQLADLPGLPARSYARLRPLITALPGDSPLNVNSAPPEVLQAFLPHLSPAALSRLLAERRRQPFTSVESFLIAARLEAEDDEDEEEEDTPPTAVLQPEQLAIGSSWFRLEGHARLAQLEARRTTLLHRRSRSQRPEITWRISHRP